MMSFYEGYEEVNYNVDANINRKRFAAETT
jgi:hypothetical protein